MFTYRMSAAVTPSIHERSERRSSILRSTVRTLSRHGFQGSTTRRIARDAGVSEALLYKHFRSKEELLDAVLDHLVDTFESAPEVRRLEQQQLADREFLVGFARGLLQKAQRNPEEVRILFYAGLQGHVLASKYYERQVKTLLEVVAKRIEDGQKEGKYRKMPPMMAASCYMSMLRSQILKIVIFGRTDSPFDGADWPEQFVEIFVRGISKK